jgi:hypothetical protein
MAREARARRWVVEQVALATRQIRRSTWIEVFGDCNINDIQSKEDIWKKNGGEIITMSPDESKRYIDAVSPVVASILSANPKVKEDYEALLAAAKRYR